MGLTDKQREKLEKALGIETIKELEAESPEQLKNRIVNASQAMEQAKSERDALPAYKEAKENVKALSEGLREVNKRQKAIIKFALAQLEG